jgi:hypothetical protein
MKKASYRLLQWTMLLGTTALMATACVVTTDDDDDSPFDGGEGGTSSAGKGSAEAGEGGSTKAGTSSGGNAGSSTGGTAAGGTAAGGDGGTGPTYIPGLCQADEPQATMLPSCAPLSTDETNGGPCKVCMKAKCCTEWQACFGDTPTTACGWGETEESPGQFDCIKTCYRDTPNGSDDLEMTLSDCADACLNQCESDGLIMDDTNLLVGCAQTACQNECFPAVQ